MESVTAEVFFGHVHAFHLFLFVADLFDIVNGEVKTHLLEVAHHGLRRTARIGLSLLVAFHHRELVAAECRREFLGQKFNHRLESDNLLCHVRGNHARVICVGNKLGERFAVATGGAHHERDLVLYVEGGVVVHGRRVRVVNADDVRVLFKDFANAGFAVARFQELDGLAGDFGFVFHDNFTRQGIRNEFEAAGHAGFGHNAAHVARNTIYHHLYRHNNS